MIRRRAIAFRRGDRRSSARVFQKLPVELIYRIVTCRKHSPSYYVIEIRIRLPEIIIDKDDKMEETERLSRDKIDSAIDLWHSQVREKL